jgi:hypothetical protein
MRLLLDECVPKRLKREFPEHDVRTVAEAGWCGLKNSALLQSADGVFDALVTVDQGLPHQQNLTGLHIALVVIVAATNDIDDLRPLLPRVHRALAQIRPGEVFTVESSA